VTALKAQNGSKEWKVEKSGLVPVAVFTAGYIHTYSQKNAILLLLFCSARIMCFLRFSIAEIRPNFKKNLQISIYLKSA
jgi:hypothetical protein